MSIYLVVEGYYSDWNILGYFTNRDEADKWCILKANRYKYCSPYVIPADCLDGKADVSNVKPLYAITVSFRYRDGTWEMYDIDDKYIAYGGDIKANSVWDDRGKIIDVTVNQNQLDYKKAEKIAQDLLYQYLDMRETTENAQKEFNWMLAAPQRAREAAKEEEALK